MKGDRGNKKPALIAELLLREIGSVKQTKKEKESNAFMTEFDQEMFLKFAAAMEEKIKEAEARFRWIPVEERLPDENMYVLVAQKNGFYNVRLRRRDTGRWSTGAAITHWMPLPPAPDHIPNVTKIVTEEQE